MSLAARLSRLTPALSGKQRALLVIRAHLNEAEPDPDVLATMPAEQRREYDYFVALLYTSNGALGILNEALSQLVARLEEDHERYAILSKAASLLEEQMGEKAEPKNVRGWQTRRNISLPDFLRGLENDLRSRIRREGLLFWRQLRALEVLWAEIAGECDGEDLRSHQIKVRVEETKKALLAVLQELAPRDAKHPPEPTEDLIAGLRTHVDEAMRMMGLREPA